MLAANFSINNDQHQWTLEFSSQAFCHIVNQSDEAMLWLFAVIFVALIVGFATDLPQTTPLHKLQVSSPVIYAISSACFKLFFQISFFFKSWSQGPKENVVNAGNTVGRILELRIPSKKDVVFCEWTPK